MDGTVTRNSFDVLVQPTPGVGVVAACFVKMPPIGLRVQMRQERGDCILDVALKAQTDTAAATQMVWARMST